MPMNVADVMTRHPRCCTADCSLQAVAQLMAERDCGAIPVVGDLATRRPLGIITDRDIVVRALASERNVYELTVRDCMSSPAYAVTEDIPLKECIELLEQRQVRRMLVVDGEGQCIGIVAQADIATFASKRTAGELLQEVSQPTDAATLSSAFR